MAQVLTIDLAKTLYIDGEVLPLAEILATIKDGCDGAVQRDGTGFNRDDLIAGAHKFVDYLQTNPGRLKLSNLKWALVMCVFYQRQWKAHFPEETLSNVKAVQKRLKEV